MCAVYWYECVGVHVDTRAGCQALFFYCSQPCRLETGYMLNWKLLVFSTINSQGTPVLHLFLLAPIARFRSIVIGTWLFTWLHGYRKFKLWFLCLQILTNWAINLAKTIDLLSTSYLQEKRYMFLGYILPISLSPALSSFYRDKVSLCSPRCLKHAVWTTMALNSRRSVCFCLCSAGIKGFYPQQPAHFPLQ